MENYELIYPSFFENKKHVDCEHRSFHMNAKINNGARLKSQKIRFLMTIKEITVCGYMIQIYLSSILFNNSLLYKVSRGLYVFISII